MAEADDPRIDILKRVVSALNRHSADGVVRHFSQACVLDSHRGPYPHGQRFSGLPAVQSAFRSFFNRIPDIQYEEPEISVAGNRGIVLSNLRGTSMSGERVDVRACLVLDFEDVKIVRIDSYWKDVR